MALTTLKTLLLLSELLRTLATDCLLRISLRGNLFIEQLPSNGNPSYSINRKLTASGLTSHVGTKFVAFYCTTY
jgi:hypothetical protein